MLAQVVNNCLGPHYIQGQPAKDGQKGKAGALLVLRPGLNLVDTKDLSERRKSNAAFDGLFKATVKSSRHELADPSRFGKPMLEVVGKELDDKAPLAKLTYEEASAAVAQTLNTDLLNSWLKQAKPTDQIVSVIKDRIKFLTTGIDARAV